MRIKNLLITIIMISLAGYGGLKIYVWKKATSEVDKVFTAFGYGMTAAFGLEVVADYKHISASLFGDVGVKGISIKIPEFDQAIMVSEIKLFERDFDIKKGNLPPRVHILITGLKMDISLYDKIGESLAKIERQHKVKKDPNELITRLEYQKIMRRSNDLRSLGYRNIEMDLELDMSMDIKNQDASLFMRLNFQNLGEYKIDVKLAGMSGNVNSAVLGVRIKEAKIEFVDKSYVNRLIKLYANENKMSLPIYRKKLIENIKQDIAQKEIKLSKDSIKNILTFVNKPDKIVFTIYPYRPVAIESLKHYKVGDIPRLLNLQAHLK